MYKGVLCCGITVYTQLTLINNMMGRLINMADTETEIRSSEDK